MADYWRTEHGTTYAGHMLQEVLDNGPADGEDFYRVKATGARETHWFNVTPQQLEEIRAILTR